MRNRHQYSSVPEWPNGDSCKRMVVAHESRYHDLPGFESQRCFQAIIQFSIPYSFVYLLKDAIHG